ncbi:hypothetical protein RJ639_002292, partial [Escallonia herrerae]
CIYPASWVGDQTLLNRAAGKAEFERSLDPPSLNKVTPSDRPRRGINEPVVAFCPPGSSGELNVSVIVSSVPLDFSRHLEDQRRQEKAVLRAITGSGQRSDVKGTLIQSTIREDSMKNINTIGSNLDLRLPRFNVTMSPFVVLAPGSSWSTIKLDFYKIADSFSLA